jgi:hypothetical protein
MKKYVLYIENDNAPPFVSIHETKAKAEDELCDWAIDLYPVDGFPRETAVLMEDFVAFNVHARIFRCGDHWAGSTEVTPFSDEELTACG